MHGCSVGALYLGYSLVFHTSTLTPNTFRRKTTAIAKNDVDQSQRTTSSASIPLPSSDTVVPQHDDIISSSDYAQKCRELMDKDKDKDLRDLGCATTAHVSSHSSATMFFDIPRIAVICAQSGTTLSTIRPGNDI